MPRIRNIKDLVFFKADKADQYDNIGSLFRGSIDWELIARHMKDIAARRYFHQSGQDCAIDDPAPPRDR